MAGDRTSTHRSVRWLLIALLGLSLVWAAPGAQATARQATPAGPHIGSGHSLLVASLELTARSAPAGVHADHARSVDATPAVAPSAAGLAVLTTSRVDSHEVSRASRHATGSRAPPVEGVS